MLKAYFQNIFKTYKSGKPTEPSFYPDLKKLLDDFLTSKGVAPHVTIEERKTESGKPDFVVRKGRGELVGYVEAKDISIENLQTLENTDQIKRYKKLPNFILTNYFDFWLWREGKWIKKVRAGMPAALKRVKTAPPPQNEDELLTLLDSFFSYYIPERKSAKTLAKELADRAQLMPEYIIHELTDSKTDEIDRIYKAFKDYLITDLTEEDFADIYAQTITYGLFTARLDYPNKKGFDRFVASQHIPKNIQILHDTFSLISSTALPESIGWIVDDIAAVLANADIKTIKKELHTKKGADDPLVHFYETFLAEYDPKKRKSRGVYYTPLPVVSFITRSVNIILKEKFGIKGGLAGENVTLLDPAAGTLTFPAHAIRLAIEERSKQWGPGGTKSFIKDHILKHFHAFELLMAPYVIGHLKISLLLQDFGYEFDIKDKSDRFKLFLTNTLDFDPVKESSLPFSFALSEEAKRAEKVKKEEKILVILGNPPYSSSASEPTKFSKEKMKDYLTGLGVEDEKKKGVIQDDYIRFIRFTHWKINEANRGVVGLITNNSYLDGLIHRAMRKKLLDDFDEIYILNLHGNSRIGENTPDEGKDENVFDIQQGVAIALFINTGEKKKEPKIFYQDVWGLRESKYKFLNKNDIKTTKWQKLEPRGKFYFFTPKDYFEKELYDKFFSVTDIFDQHVSGIESQKDSICIHWNREGVRSAIGLLTSNEPNNLIQNTYKIKDSRDWKIDEVRKRLRKGLDTSKITQILYRPFDNRWTYFDDYFLAYPRKPLTDYLFDKHNLGLNLVRQLKLDNKFSHVLVTERPADRVLLSSTTSEGGYIFPLWQYRSSKSPKMLSGQEELGLVEAGEEKILNFKTETFCKIEGLLKSPAPEEVFYYIYAILYSNTYRQKYQEFLKIDFPKIPFTKDCTLFQKLAKLGKELVDLHLLRSPELGAPVAKFYGKNSNRVEKREYRNRRVYINESQYFEKIKKEVWEYHIGGYQVLDKWLKDRKGRELSSEDVKHYCKIVTALQKTLELQNQIDKLYPEVEKKLIAS